MKPHNRFESLRLDCSINCNNEDKKPDQKSYYNYTVYTTVYRRVHDECNNAS